MLIVRFPNGFEVVYKDANYVKTTNADVWELYPANPIENPGAQIIAHVSPKEGVIVESSPASRARFHPAK